MRLKVNGEWHELEGVSTVQEVLDRLRVPARFVAVALDEECVPRAEYETRQIHEGGELEILSPHQGG